MAEPLGLLKFARKGDYAVINLQDLRSARRRSGENDREASVSGTWQSRAYFCSFGELVLSVAGGQRNEIANL